MKPQPSKVSPLKKALFGGWLANALFVSGIIFAIMVSSAFAADLYYQRILKDTASSQTAIETALSQFRPSSNTISQEPVVTTIPSFETINPVFTESPTVTPKNTASPTPKITQAPGSTATPTQAPTSTATPTNRPQATNTPTTVQATNTPTQVPQGCFVTVSGYLYNMQPAIGTTAVDPNTGKTRVHTSGDYQCGSQTSPTDMTAVYLAKHSTMGCAARLAPYIVTPPAPTDPTCE